MNLLQLIASETNGKSYQSLKFCLESELSRELSYDDKQTISFKENGESEKFTTSRYLKEKADIIQRKTKPIFKYFLDGSRRTYKIDEIAYNRRIYPIIAGQIGVGCCARLNPDKFINQLTELKLVISLPEVADKDNLRDKFFNDLTRKINSHSKLKNRQIEFYKTLYYDISDDSKSYEDNGIIKIQNEMIDLEKKVVVNLTEENLLNEDSYLIKDGSIEYQRMKTGDYKDLSIIKNSYRRVVGISKRFNPELCVDHRGKSNAEMIANLPLFHRTPAFKYESTRSKGAEGSVYFSIWYLRIRDTKYTSNPLDGVVKVEKMLVTDTENINGLESEDVDLISANIINERNPVCFGSDVRWANHLYPVYLTEKFIKSRYLSDLHFLNLFN
jgi:hypothetical protein